MPDSTWPPTIALSFVAHNGQRCDVRLPVECLTLGGGAADGLVLGGLPANQARLFRGGERLFVQPLDEGAPVVVNGRLVSHIEELVHGDRVEMGPYRMVVGGDLDELAPFEESVDDATTAMTDARTVPLLRRDEPAGMLERLWSALTMRALG